MDLVGEFQKGEIDEKLFLVYHNVIKPLPQIHTLNSSDRLAIDSGDELPPQPYFLCPRFRARILLNSLDQTMEPRLPSSEIFSKYTTSPLLDDSNHDHHVLPLFWCNNKEADPKGECYTCKVAKFSAYYYFCVTCDKRFHKECVESPLEISYPSHFKHSLQLYYSRCRSDHCIYCRKRATYIIYYCALCNIYMHVLCAQKNIPFFIDQPKRHDHTLTLFPRLASLPCNICALVNKLHLTYACSMCNFLVHDDCLNIPQTIRISRHHHRVSFTFLPLAKSSCGVCRQVIDNDYGAYTCNVCSGYAVHTKCALRKDICDGKELEGVPEEKEDGVESFERIADGVILHFAHGHRLKFEISGVYDDNKFCHACVLPIYEGSLYVCVECDFILHKTCAEAPRKKFHPSHPHPLKLEAVAASLLFHCGACTRWSNGFVYGCPNQDCDYQLDIQCALVSEPFKYEGHQHLLSSRPKREGNVSRLQGNA